MQQQGHTCSQTASCALTVSTTATSPKEAALHSVLSTPAEPLLCTRSQPAAGSQLSTVTADGMCASEAVQAPQGAAQRGAHQGAQGGAQGGVQEGAQGVLGAAPQGVQRAAQRQGKSLVQPLKCAVTSGAQTDQDHTPASNLLVTKAGLLVELLLEPAPLFAMLGFKAKEGQDLELQTTAAQIQAQAVVSSKQTEAGFNSLHDPARAGTAAIPVGTEAAGAAAGCRLTNDMSVSGGHDAQVDQHQAKGKQDCGGSLLTLLGLGGVTEGLGRDAHRLTSGRECEEEEAGVQVDRQAGIAMHVVEILLDAALTQSEVSCCPPPPAPPARPPPPPPPLSVSPLSGAIFSLPPKFCLCPVSSLPPPLPPPPPPPTRLLPFTFPLPLSWPPTPTPHSPNQREA